MLCKLFVLGKISSDIDFIELGEGKSRGEFMVEAETGYGEYKEIARIPVLVFNKKAEFIMKYMHMGTAVVLEGTFHTKDSDFWVTATSVSFAESKKEKQ